MKKVPYEEPEMEVIILNEEDIITGSNESPFVPG